MIQDFKMPSSRVRILNLLPELQKAGIYPTVVKYPKKYSEKIGLFKTLGKFDFVCLQKKLPSPFEVKIIRKLSNNFIFDFDDAIYYRHDSQTDLVSWTRFVKFKYLIRNVDNVIAGNRFLADYAAQFNKNVIIIPSAVETRDIPLKDYTDFNDNIIIGWIGGTINLNHLQLLTSVFQKLSHEYKIQIRILCSRTTEIPSVEVRHIPWSLETQEKEIALFDIGVMPLLDNKHTEGKCGYKALQYMAAAVPPVVSDVGINRDIVEQGKTGFVAQSIDDFYNAIKILISNAELRKYIGNNARKKVEKNFSVSVIGKMLAHALYTGT